MNVKKGGQRGETMHGWDLDSYANRAKAFGWHTIEIDGHDVEAIDEAFGEAAAQQAQPTVIVAHTLKGKGVKEVEDKPNWHGKALDHPEEAIAELGGERPNPREGGNPAGRGPDPFRGGGGGGAAAVRGRGGCRAAGVGARRRGGDASCLRRRAGGARLDARRRGGARRRG